MRIAVFDFDGTIISKDSFLEFIIFSKGIRKFLFGFALLSPVILLFKLGIMNNGKAKQIVFSFFFKGDSLSKFNHYCSEFSALIDKYMIEDALMAIQEHQRKGSTVLIVSASIENWILPWAKKRGIDEVVATKLDIDQNDCLNGRFLTPNCYGLEKKRRLLEAYPNRKEYSLFVYGDSKGDKALLDYADHSFLKNYK